MNYAMQYRPSGLAVGSYIRLEDAPTGMTVYAMRGTQRLPATYVAATPAEVAHYHIPVEVLVSNLGERVPVTVFAYPADGSPFRSTTTEAQDGVTPLAWGEFRDPNAWTQTEKTVAAGVAILAVVGIGYALWPKDERHQNPSRRSRR